MKKLLLVLGSFAAACVAFAEPVTVYDLGVQPDSPNKKVTVTYRLTETASGYADVAVNISSNAGATWNVPADTFYPGSDIGPGVRADGSLRQFVWDARADWNHQYSTQMIMRLNATASETRPSIFFTSRANGNLYRMNLDGSDLVIEASGAYEVAYSFVAPGQSRIYMVEWQPGGRVHFYDPGSGSGINLLHNGPGWGGQGGAYDPVAERLFVGRYYAGLFGLQMNSTGSWQHLVTVPQLSPMIGQRGQLELDPVHQHVYFRSAYNHSCNNCRWIWRVNYDGSGLTQIVLANNGDGLALDLAAGHLYYTDGDDTTHSVTLNRANLDGSSPQVLLALPPPYEFVRTIHLDLPRNKIYYLLLDHRAPAPFDRAVGRSNLDGTGFEIVRELPDSTYGPVEGMALLVAP